MDLLPYMVNSSQMLMVVTLVRPATVENRKYSGSSAPYIIYLCIYYLPQLIHSIESGWKFWFCVQ